MTSPFHARDIRGRGRYYTACQPSCPLGNQPLISITNAQGVIAKPALVPAAVKITAAKAWDVLPRMVALSRHTDDTSCATRRVADRCGRCRFCLTAEIKAEHRNQWEHAADTGTRVHAHAEAAMTGRALPHDPEVAPYIDQYQVWLNAWHIDPDKHVEAAEITVYDHDNGYAGTGDVWIHLPTGPAGRRQLWLIDIKTSAHKPANTVYIDQVLQLAALRYAPSGLLADDTELVVPKFAGAALLNLRTQSHALIPLPADQAAHQAFLAAVKLQTFLHDQDVKTWVPLDVTTIPDPHTVPDKDVA